MGLVESLGLGLVFGVIVGLIERLPLLPEIQTLGVCMPTAAASGC
jgi:hypothetical protein